MIKFLNIIVLMAFLCPLSTKGQVAPKEFPAEDIEFVKAYGSYISSNNRPDAKELAQLLNSILLPATNTSANLAVIKSTANAMLAKKMPIFPYFNNYARFLLNSNKTVVAPEIVAKNFTILEGLLNSGRKNYIKEFNDYIAYLENVYARPGSIYNDKSRSWDAIGSYVVKTDSARPYFEFKQVTLIGITDADTVIIKNTSGYFYPMTSTLVGFGGTMDWRRHHLDTNKVYAKLDSIVLDLGKSDLSFPNATLTYLPYFEKTFKGLLKDYLSQSISTKNNFPNFLSQEWSRVSNLSKEVALDGRIYVEGTNIYVASSDTSESNLSISDKSGTPVVTATAPRFMIKDYSEILADRVDIKMQFASDLISHPGLTFSYNVKTRTVKANRDNKAYSRMPFYSTYYKVSMLPDQLLWNIDSNFIEINPLSVHTEKPAYFESFNYYKKGIETKYSIGLDFDPLQALAQYYFNNQSFDVDVNTVAGMFGRGYNVKQIENLLYALQADGYINYNSVKGMVKIYDKTILHVNASKKKEDYDVIRFASENKQQVGKIKLNNKEIEIYGVKNIEMSNSKNVEVFPTSDTVILGENRSITVKGRLQAGKVNFYSKRLDFKYDEFIFKMNKIDSMLIMVPIGTGIPAADGTIQMQEISTPLQDISGTLYIDDPDNKSGQKNNLRFPYFDCTDSAYIYYDRGSNSDRYSRDSFYFVVYPFQFDSMNTFETKNLRFDGMLVSQGIFEDFETQIGIQEDLSLGFTIQAPSKGYNLYGAKNKIYDEIHLDNIGLIAKGNIQRPAFIAHITKSELYPKLYRGVADSITFTQDIKGNTPQGYTSASKITWLPKSDSLAIFADDNKFSFYNENIQLQGGLTYVKDKLYGSGEATMNKALFTSNQFELKAKTFESKAADVSIRTPDNHSVAINLKDNTFVVDFDKSMAFFKSNEKDKYGKLPFYKYITNANNLDWDFQKDEIKFSNKDYGNSKFYFISADPAKDSLGFSAIECFYDLHDNTLTARGVQDVLIADSKIIPKGNILNLDSTGEFRSFDEARMVMPVQEAYHKLENVHMTINSKNDFKGFGDLIYVADNKSQKIKVEELIPDYEEYKDEKYKNSNSTLRKYFVKARGAIAEEEKYYLDKRILYRGDVHFTSLSPDLLLDGFAKLDLPKDTTEWFAIAQSISTKSTSITLDSLYNEFKQPLHAGIFIDKASYLHYPSVLNAMNNEEDIRLFEPGGILQNGPELDVITYGDPSTIKGVYPYGNIMKYNVNTRIIDATGTLHLADKFSDYCTIYNYGNIKYKGVDSLLRFTATFALDFFLDETSKSLLVKGFTENNANAPTSGFSKNTIFQRGMYNIMKDKIKNSDVVISDMATQGMFIIPQDFPANMVFSDVNWYWDDQEGTFKNIDRVGMMVLGNKGVALKTKAYLEVAPRGDRTFVNVYIEAANGIWYYFRYLEGVMSVQSSDPVFIENFRLTSESDKVVKKGKNNIVFYLEEPNSNMKDNFVARIEEFKDRIGK